ncbi:MAG: PEGA domain-containing protein [Candidatus Sericytochromatia bacterium]
MKKFLASIVFITSFISINNLQVTAKDNKKEDTQNTKANLEVNFNIALPYFTILDKNLESNTQVVNLHNKVRERLKNISKFKVIEIEDSINNMKILTSDQIIPIGLKTGADLVLTGVISKMGEDIVFNMRLSETVIGKVLLDKQYFSEKNDFSNIIENIETDLTEFITNLKDYDVDIYNLNSGNSLIRVKSIPSGAKVALDGVEIGKTPLSLKNISDKEHLIETWLEKDGIIKDFNLLSEDNKLFQFKFDDKLYTESIIEIDNLKRSPEGYNFEIVANPDDKGIGRERPKATDIKYDLRRFKMEIFTEPQNLQVVLDDKDIGASPISIDKILPGKHNIKLAKKKLIVFKKLIDSSKNKITELDFNMFKLGRLLVSSTPKRAEIFVNNEKLGETPKSVDLPFGEHDIEIRRDGYKNETYKVNIEEGKTNELNINLSSLRNVDTNISILPTASVDDILGISGMFLSLGQYNSSDNKLKGLTYLYGGEINYGFRNIFSIGEYFNFSTQIGAFYNKLSPFTLNIDFPSNQGLGGKIQFLNQSDTIPVSAAIGAFYNFNNSVSRQLNGYLAISRDFKFISVHLGVQAQPFRLSAVNLSINYNRFYRVKFGASVLIDFGLLADKPNEYITPLFGLTAGYNFF